MLRRLPEFGIRAGGFVPARLFLFALENPLLSSCLCHVIDIGEKRAICQLTGPQGLLWFACLHSPFFFLLRTLEIGLVCIY